MTKTDYAYIATKPCGCIVMATVDFPEHKREVAKEVGKAIRQGYTVERVAVSYVREHWECSVHEGQRLRTETVHRLKGLD